MIRRILALAAAPILALAATGTNSNQMNHFALQKCEGSRCFNAAGAVGFLSMQNDVLAAPFVRLSYDLGTSKKRAMNCDSFQYDLVTRLLVCDNRESGRDSITIDDRFMLSTFHSREKSPKNPF